MSTPAADDAKIKLLVVEDDPYIALALTTYGKHMGYDVFHADNGFRAVELGAQVRPQVILLDIALPGMDGRDVFARLQALGVTQKAVVIFATARDSQIDRIVGLEMGADDYETKPFHLETLFHKIDALLQKKKSGEI